MIFKKLALTAATAAVASMSLAATAGAAQVTITPASLDFGSQTVGTTSAPRNVQVDVPCLYVLDLGQYGGKSCSAPGKLEAVDTTGDFAYSHGCPLPISNSSTSGEIVTCNIAVTFSPEAAGPRTGALNLASYGTADAYVVPLAGSGAALPTGGGTGTGGSKDKSSQGGAAGSVSPSKKCRKGKAAKKARRCKRKKKVAVS